LALETRKLVIDSSPVGAIFKLQANGLVDVATTVKEYELPYGSEVVIIFDPSLIYENRGHRYKGFVLYEDGTIVDRGTETRVEFTLTANTRALATYEVVTYFPVRDPFRRGRKYEGKVDHEVYERRFHALRDMMVEQVRATASEQYDLEVTVGRILHAKGVYGTWIHHYRNFSQELYSLKRRFEDLSLAKEAALVIKKWKERGLDEAILKEIAKALGVPLSS